MDFTSGCIALIMATCASRSRTSEVPVQIYPGASILSTSPAAIGSETAQNITGISVSSVAAKAAFAAGVAIAIIIS